MPTGDYNYIPFILSKIRKINPKKILEIGPGFGKWGVLIREYLEVYKNLRFHKKDWLIQLDAVEICPYYKNKLKDFIYNHVYWRSVQKFIEKPPETDYDLVIMIDVLEHMNKKEGSRVLQGLQRISNNLIVEVPGVLYSKISKWHKINPYEDHKCCWNRKELENIGFQTINKFENGPFIAHWKEENKYLKT